jgi:hypothetical protein
MRVENINDRPNQFIITDNYGTETFQSYKSKIAIKWYSGTVHLDEYYWDYSRTTSRYRNIFLGETKKETEQKIISGEYKLVNLN